MRRGVWVALGFVVVWASGASTAQAQYGYPGGYGRYGWGGWGIATDPASGYMTGLGNYARSYGQYEVSDAQATSMNIDNVVKWNKALRAENKRVNKQRAEYEAKLKSEALARASQADIESGAMLNYLLDRMTEFQPSASKAYSSKVPLSPEVIRDIPFESASEALTVCLDQMTGDDAWPPTLQDARFGPDRAAIRKAVKKALEEDEKGNVSAKTAKEISDAVAKLRAKYVKSNGQFDLLYADADEFSRSLAGLSGLLTNPRLKQIINQIQEYKRGTVGDLIAFMQSFNLRFGAAVSDRQKEIYHQLLPMFQQAMTESRGAAVADNNTDLPTPPLPSAAREVFKGMDWKHIEASQNADKKQ